MVSIVRRASTSQLSNLRPFDPGRDLAPAADLIELCFAQTLDQDGQQYLQRMRQAARDPVLLRWTGLSAGWAGVPMEGYVWEEDGRLAGNLSLIPYSLHGRRCYMIANVAVHPDYRRRGIGRALTAKAIEHSRQRAAPQVWLQVREENEAAISLYLSLGFLERARRTTWHSQNDYLRNPPPDDLIFGPRRARHWPAQQAWLSQNYPAELTWHLSLKIDALRPGLWGSLYRGFNDLYVQQWVVQRGTQALALVAWLSSASAANTLWLAAPPDSDELAITHLLLFARQQAPTHRLLALDYPARQSAGAIHQAGFVEHQTLMWMVKRLQ